MADGNVPVITGIGMITGLGIGTEKNWERMVRGESGIRRIQRFNPARLPTQIGGEMPDDFESMVKEKLKKMTIKRTADFTQLAILCSKMALEDSGIDLTNTDPERCGVIIGNCMGGIEYLEKKFREFSEDFKGNNIEINEIDNVMAQVIVDRMENLFGLKYMQNAMSAQIGIDNKLNGPNLVISTACAAGAMSAEYAAEYIRRGVCDMVIAGGAEIFVNESTTMGFNKLTALSLRNNEPERACRPFEKDRDGTVLGDGAGIVIIESEAKARKRGAKIYARLIGYANLSEGYSLASPEPKGTHMGMVMSRAMEHAGINPEQVDYLNAHGTATIWNDRAEANGTKLAFGDHAKTLPVSSVKSMIGHTIGAAGGIELCLTALSLSRGIITPTINYDTPDPHCDLNIVGNESRDADLKIAASNSFALGGHNSCLILEKV